MKILHVAPDLQNGGSCRLALDLACHLQRNGGTENVVFSPSDGMAGAMSQAGVKHVVCLKPGLLGFFANPSRLHRAVRRHRPDIILAYGARAAWEAGRACRYFSRARRPKIVGVLTTYPNIGTTSRGLAYCDAFTAVSKHLREALEKFSPLARRKGVWVIPYGVDERQCYPDYGPSAAWIEHWNALHPLREEGQTTLCVPGAITPRHGQEDVIPLLTALHRFNLYPRVLIAGDLKRADAAYLRRLRRKIKEAGLEQDIVWIGAPPDLRDVFCVSDAVLSLNKEPAAYDRAILEALALGCPVAGYDHGAVGEMLHIFLPEGDIAPGKPELMADTIFQWSVYHPGTVDSVPYPYRMSDTVENYMALFHSLLERKTGPEQPATPRP